MSSYWSGRLPFASEPGSCLNPRLELTGGAVSCDHAPGEEVYNYPDASSEGCLSRWMQGCWSDLFHDLACSRRTDMSRVKSEHLRRLFRRCLLLMSSSAFLTWTWQKDCHGHVISWWLPPRVVATDPRASYGLRCQS